MFSGILSSDSQIIVFERNVSDLFFSSVPIERRTDHLRRGRPSRTPTRYLFGIVSSSDHPIITCFGITEADARLRQGKLDSLGIDQILARTRMVSCLVNAQRSS